MAPQCGQNSKKDEIAELNKVLAAGKWRASKREHDIPDFDTS